MICLSIFVAIGCRRIQHFPDEFISEHILFTLNDHFRVVFGWHNQIDIVCFSRNELVVIYNFLTGFVPIKNPPWVYEEFPALWGPQPMALYIESRTRNVTISIVQARPSSHFAHASIEFDSSGYLQWFAADAEAYFNLLNMILERQ